MEVSRIRAFGLDPDDFTEEERRKLAEHTRRFIQEELGKTPDSVSVEPPEPKL